VLDQGGGAVPLGLAAAHNRAAALTLALAACALGFIAAERGIAPDRPLLRARRLFRGLALLSGLLSITVWLLPEAEAVPLVNFLLGVMLIGHVVPACTWRSLAGGPARLPVAIAVMAGIAVAGVFLVYGAVPAGPAPGGVLFRWLFAGIALPAMLAIAFAVVDVRRAREAALEAALQAAEKETRTATALLAMEKEYARARDIAAGHSRRISTVTHDIRQPIAALRAELDTLKAGAQGETVARLDRIVGHFDGLIDDLGAPANDTSAGPVAGNADGEAEAVPATLLFSMLERLFAADAAAAGIELRFVASAAVFHARAVVLMRIASNLVANAIAHSGGSRILVGIRRRDGALCLDVLDNGCGFATVDFDTARQSGIKGETSRGSGLGLSIVDELAGANGYGVTCRSIADKGTAFSIAVPR